MNKKSSEVAVPEIAEEMKVRHLTEVGKLQQRLGRTIQDVEIDQWRRREDLYEGYISDLRDMHTRHALERLEREEVENNDGN